MSMTLTCGNLVYVRTLKCASTFFWDSFKNLGWWEIEFDSIDWKNQQVFSHMMDPDHRRHKGVAEYINMYDAYDLFYHNETFRKFIAHVPSLDQHSISYHDQYGNYCNLIDWIPLSGRSHDFTWWLSPEESVAKTDLLLRHYGVKVFDRWAWDRKNGSSDRQKKLEKDLEELWCKDQPHQGDWYLERDRLLYNRVISKFNYNGATWPETSWLG
jgi:hypothetical protein